VPERYAIRPAAPRDLPAAARLIARTLGFAPADAIAPWVMRTTGECGGITLVATDGAAVVGALHSIAGVDGEGRFLFTCGLAVAAPHRGHGIGLELKREQRRRALAAGYERIRWTADPVNGRALRLYVAGLGARLVRYRAGLHDGLRADPGHSQDDVELRWDLGGTAAPRAGPAERHAVDLPWTAASGADRARVRGSMARLLAAGCVGTDVQVDHAARRCAVVFTPR